MLVGDTHTIQALSAAGQPVTELTWTSSDPTILERKPIAFEFESMGKTQRAGLFVDRCC
jgi:hypothetical protein